VSFLYEVKIFNNLLTRSVAVIMAGATVQSVTDNSTNHQEATETTD